jgi:predicted DNA-binding mobile mystery protein A
MAMRSPRSIARQRLDTRLDGLGERIGPNPPHGWLRAVRQALGMSTAEMGERMGVSQARINQLERAEVSGSIRLSTLERAAAALNCQFRYAFIPDIPLEEAVQRQALAKAGVEVAAATHHMRLENQVPDASVIDDQVTALADELIDARGLWRAP